MTRYTVNIHDRQYNSYDYQSLEYISDSTVEQTPSKHPLEIKCFHEDEIQWNGNTSVAIIKQSPLRDNPQIPGILILENNRTYGRTDNKKRLYYKCRPYDPHYPDFLVPYTIPMGFHKNFQNKYVTFKFNKWEADDKHPYGILSQTIGEVHHLPSFYEYQLYCYSLHNPITPCIQFCKQKIQSYSKESLMNIIDSNPCIYGPISSKIPKQGSINTSREYIFTVDPPGCKDRDDALSIKANTTPGLYNKQFIVSVYIANVWVWAEAMDLWSLLGTRVSTIYLPDSKRSMLPSLIAEDLCSLDQSKDTYAFTIDFTVEQTNDKTTILQNPSIYQSKIAVQHNYDYEEPALLKNSYYKRLRDITVQLDTNVQDSHDVVAYWMTQMNIHIADIMWNYQFGIFRTLQQVETNHNIESSDRPPPPPPVPSSSNNNNNTSISHLSRETQTFLTLREQNLHGQYVYYSSTHPNVYHEMLKVRHYTHITSPIRRLVDLLNQIMCVQFLIRPFDMREEPKQFVENQCNNLHIIQATMKRIQKVQNQCNILAKITSEPQWTEQHLEAIVLSREPSIESNKYSIYIPTLNWVTTIYRSNEDSVKRDLCKFDSIQCKLYVFEREDQMRKKVRVQFIS